MLGAVPRIVLEDPACDEQLDLGKMFREEYRTESGSRKFAAGGESFSITDVLLKPGADSRHSIHLCAHKRVVESLSLRHHLRYVFVDLQRQSVARGLAALGRPPSSRTDRPGARIASQQRLIHALRRSGPLRQTR